VQKTLFRDPAPSNNKLFVHDRDLTGWPTKADEAQLEPKAHRLPKTNLGGLLEGVCVQRDLKERNRERGAKRKKKTLAS
jgi:hypothetical protein